VIASEDRLPESKAFGAIYFSVAISYLGVGLVAPLIAVVLADRGENSLMVGMIGTTTFAAFTFASFPLGTLTDRIGSKPVLIGGLVVYAASILAFAFVRETSLFFVVRAVEGVGAAAISVATETMISWFSAPGERARRMSYYALAVGLGWAAGPLSGTLLFGISQAVPFVGCAALSFAAAIIASKVIPTAGTVSHEHSAVRGVFSLQLLVPISAGALYGYLMSSLVTLFPLYLARELRVAETSMGLIITAVILGTIASQVPIGRAADRFGKQTVLLVSSALLMLVFVAMAMQNDWRMFLPTGALTGALAGALYPIGLSIIGEQVPRARLGAATSLFSLAFGIGSLVGPGASGSIMTATTNPRWLFYLPALLTAVFVIELAVLRWVVPVDAIEAAK
jgi:MFS family permease